MKKGFTLIELITMIIILGVIALIVSPIMLGMIRDAKENANLNSAKLFIRAVDEALYSDRLSNKYVQNGAYQITDDGNICLSTIDENGNCQNVKKINYSGERAKCGVIVINDSKTNMLSNVVFGGESFSGYVDELSSVNGSECIHATPKKCFITTNGEYGVIILSSLLEQATGRSLETYSLEELSELLNQEVTSYEDAVTKVFGNAIINYTSEDSDCPSNLIIPNDIGVDTISMGFGEKNIETVVIPEGIKKIDSTAFQDNNISYLYLPESLEYIGTQAFYNNNISTLVIPDNVKKIGYGAFMKNKLTNVELPEGLEFIDTQAFANNELTSVKIPGSVKKIGMYSFANNKLTNVELSTGLEEIADMAFYKDSLSSIIIPDTVTRIGDMAFYENKLSSIEIPSSVEEIADLAFEYNKIETVIFKEPSSLKKIGWNSFSNNNIKNLSLPSSLESLGTSTFAYNEIRNLSIPSGSLSIIPRSCFYTNDIETITIPNNVTEIGEHAFGFNQNLREVRIGSGIQTIGERAFSNPNLQYVKIDVPYNDDFLNKYQFYRYPVSSSITFEWGE